MHEARLRRPLPPAAPMTAAGNDEDLARGRVYALLGNLLASPPDPELLAALCEIEPGADDSSVLAASWEMLRVAALRAMPEALQDEYQALFIGLGRGEVVPYGSWYLTCFLMEQPLAQLRADLNNLQIKRRPGVHEPEDHAAALLDVMALMISADDPQPLARQRAFFERHIEPWMAKFFADLQQADSARFYRAVGQLGEQFLGVEAQAFRMSIPSADATTLS